MIDSLERESLENFAEVGINEKLKEKNCNRLKVGQKIN